MIDLIGSFSLVVLALCFAFAQLGRLFYPRLRRPLFAMQPGVASGLQLAWILAPLLLALTLGVLLFLPPVESRLVANHCHADCGSHLPLAESPWLVWSGFGLLLIAIAYAAWAGGRQWLTVRRLEKQFQGLGENRADYILLHQDEALVFTLGWWRGKVYISRGLVEGCDQKELGIILAHENGHERRKDNLRMLAARLGLLPLTLGPFQSGYAQQLYEDLQVLSESACDFIAAARYSNLSVAESLLKVHRLVSASVALPRGVSAFAGSSTERRVRALLEEPGHRPSVTSLLLFGLGLLAGLLSAIHPLHHLSEILIR